MSKASPARLCALEITRTVRQRNAYAHELLGASWAIGQLSERDRAFATRLTLGVVERSGTLDEIINRALNKPSDIKPKVRDALKISSYELIVLGKTDYAVVDQGVELVRHVAPKAAGLANTVLRRIAELALDFPFGDPNIDDKALARREGFPLWLAQLLIKDLGREKARKFMEASNTPPPLYMVNRKGECIKASSGSLRDYLEQIDSGELVVADESAQHIAALAMPTSNKPFLEVGSGRGTKTVLMRILSQKTDGEAAPIFAMDKYDFKTAMLSERLKKLNINNVVPIIGNALEIDKLVKQGLLPNEFSSALIDAPCSGLGTLRRHPEIRWRLTPQDIEDMAQLGLALMQSVAPLVAAGGSLTYATCTVTKQENNNVLQDFLASKQGTAFKIATTFASNLSMDSADAHFAVKLVRTS